MQIATVLGQFGWVRYAATLQTSSRLIDRRSGKREQVAWNYTEGVALASAGSFALEKLYA